MKYDKTELVRLCDAIAVLGSEISDREDSRSRCYQQQRLIVARMAEWLQVGAVGARLWFKYNTPHHPERCGTFEGWYIERITVADSFSCTLGQQIGSVCVHLSRPSSSGKRYKRRRHTRAFLLDYMEVSGFKRQDSKRKTNYEENTLVKAGH